MTSSTDSDPRPRDAHSGLPIGPLAQPGYYPHFSTLAQQKFWDEKTRAVVLDRVSNVPAIRFFNEAQARLLEAICECVLPQSDRDEAHRVPIVPQIDRRLYEKSSDGYRYEGMPPDDEAFVLGLQAIDDIARSQYGRSFLAIGLRERDEILRSLHDGKPLGSQAVWERMPVHRFWMLLMSDCAEAYYSHPYAWDEIGFGGPAYPRPYMRLERGEPEPWETEETRYEWHAPPAALSGECTPLPGDTHAPSGQGGTH